jgi:hypothetical protein
MDLGLIEEAIRSIDDFLAGKSIAVFTLISSLSTLWITNHFADRRWKREKQWDQRVEQAQFERQVLCDLQDAISLDHQLALKGSREVSALTQEGLQGKVRAELAETFGDNNQKIRNLSARLGDKEIDRLTGEISDLHNNMFLSTQDHPNFETWRTEALQKKGLIDAKIHTMLFPLSTTRPRT